MQPIHPPSPHCLEAPTLPEPSPSAASILIVDDDPVVLSLLQTCLPRSGFEVWTAGGGKAALSVYEDHRDRIDIVLLDVRMPGMDGPATFRELRLLDPAVSICFMSGHTGVYDEDSLQKMGALRLFHKPFDLDELTHSLHHLVDHARLGRSA